MSFLFVYLAMTTMSLNLQTLIITTMKKIILLTAITLIYFAGSAQNFPGESIDLIIGKELRVKPKSQELQEYGYEGFFKNYKWNMVYKPIGYASFKSKYNSLVDKVFTVVSYEKNKKDSSGNTYYLLLKNQDIKKIYYKYDTTYEYGFPFEVIGGIDFPKDFFCKAISIKVDKFEKDRITYRSPIEYPVSFTKIINKDSKRFYLSITYKGSTFNVGEKGLTILFENGSKIEKPQQKIDVKMGKGKGFDYSAFIPLNEDDIIKLTNSKMTDIRMYVYDWKIQKGFYYQEYIKCLIKK